MAKQIAKWEASDGKVFDTEAEASRHDYMNELRSEIEKLTVYGNVDPDELLTALTAGKLGDMVETFREVYK